MKLIIKGLHEVIYGVSLKLATRVIFRQGS